jgi:transposase
MPGKLVIELSEEQRAELIDMRDHAMKLYLRERAAAILKIADGISGMEVARNRMNKPHWQDTIYEWVKRYRADGIAGLKVKPGSGRKPAFFPSVQESRRSK